MTPPSSPRPLVAGNWKMNGLHAEGLALARALRAKADSAVPACELLVCPPATLLRSVATALKGSAIAVGGQDCHSAAKGAHTGDISAAMLADAGARYVIVGHSERRTGHNETDAQVQAKALAAHRADLVAIICIGESEAEHDCGETLAVVTRQLAGSLPPGATAANTVVAYEPVWAIGSGRTPSAAEVGEVHATIRTALRSRVSAQLRLLYGGSVKAANAVELLAVPEVDGALVGGASLDAEEFWAIASSCR